MTGRIGLVLNQLALLALFVGIAGQQAVADEQNLAAAAGTGGSQVQDQGLELYLHLDPSEPSKAHLHREEDLVKHYQQLSRVSRVVYPLAASVSSWTALPFSLEPRQVKRWLHRAATDTQAASIYEAAVLLDLADTDAGRHMEAAGNGETGVPPLGSVPVRNASRAANSSGEVENITPQEGSKQGAPQGGSSASDKRFAAGQALQPLLSALRNAQVQLSDANALSDALARNEEVQSAATALLLCCYSPAQLLRLLPALGAAVDVLHSSRQALLSEGWNEHGTVDAQQPSARNEPHAATAAASGVGDQQESHAAAQQRLRASHAAVNSGGDVQQQEGGGAAVGARPSAHGAMHGSALVQHPGRSLQAWALGPSMTGNIAMPDGFQPLDHSMRPKLLIPLVFHVLSYR